MNFNHRKSSSEILFHFEIFKTAKLTNEKHLL